MTSPDAYNHLDAVRLNREELRGKKPSKDAAAAKAKLDKLNVEQTNLEKLKKTSPGKVDPLREAALPEEIEAAKEDARLTQLKSSKANKAWSDERDKHEPASIKSFRAQLSQCNCVKQVFDPWFMNKNTQNPAAPVLPNLQKDGNEKLHATHLHITIFDPTLPTS